MDDVNAFCILRCLEAAEGQGWSLVCPQLYGKHTLIQFKSDVFGCQVDKRCCAG